VAEPLWTLGEMRKATRGESPAPASLGIDGISIDSRSLKPDEAFIALRGPNRDGRSAETGLPDSWDLKGTNLLWRVPIGGRSAPVVMGNRVYILEYGGNQSIWEVTFPPSPPTVTLSGATVGSNGAFGFNVSGAPGLTYRIESSINLLNWFSVTSLVSTTSPFQFTDTGATNVPFRVYRAVQH